MFNRRLARIALATVLLSALVGGSALMVTKTVLKPTTIVAFFTSANGIYVGDEVKVAGVRVGTIKSVTPVGAQIRFVLTVDHGIKVPADAKAVIVAQNLVAARYIQLAPVFSGGSTFRDGAEIPVERTAVPVEWDEIKEQITRLATDLGPSHGMSSTSVSQFIDSAANALDGNGAKLRQTLQELSGVGRILADGSGDIVQIITGLQTFIEALRGSNAQIVEFQDRFASLTNVLNGSRTDLDAALTNIADVVDDVRRFVSGARGQTVEQLQRLSNVTANLVEHKRDLEQVLHVAPTSVANTYNMFDPRDGAASGAFALNNLSNLDWFACQMVGAVALETSPETAKLCSQTAGPALDSISLNYPPIPFNPFLTSTPPQSDLIYTDPKLAPGGSGPDPGLPEEAPVYSAYTGFNGDVAPPPGYGLPAMAPPSSPPALPDLMLGPDGAPEASASAPIQDWPGLMLAPTQPPPDDAPLPAAPPLPAESATAGGTPAP